MISLRRGALPKISNLDRMLCQIATRATSSSIRRSGGVIESGTPRIRLAKSLKDKKNRDRHNRILLEGWRLIRDAILAKAEPVAVFYSKPDLCDKLPAALSRNVTGQVSDSTMSLLSNATTPPGIVGVFRKPRQGELPHSVETNSDQLGKWMLPVTIICDRMKDPTNLGTVIRTAAGAGCHALMTTRGSVDMWEPKVLRCAAGGHFRVPVYYGLSWEEITQSIPNDTKIYLADNSTGSHRQLYHEVDWTPGPSVMIIGGETTGLSEDAHEFARARGGVYVRIPLMSNVESLSAGTAGAIILYEALRQLHSSSDKRTHFCK